MSSFGSNNVARTCDFNGNRTIFNTLFNLQMRLSNNTWKIPILMNTQKHVLNSFRTDCVCVLCVERVIVCVSNSFFPTLVRFFNASISEEKTFPTLSHLIRNKRKVSQFSKNTRGKKKWGKSTQMFHCLTAASQLRRFSFSLFLLLLELEQNTGGNNMLICSFQYNFFFHSLLR